MASSRLGLQGLIFRSNGVLIFTAFKMMMMYSVNHMKPYYLTFYYNYKLKHPTKRFGEIVHASGLVGGFDNDVLLQGTSTEQDTRFSDKEKKLMKQMKFGDCLTQQV